MEKWMSVLFFLAASVCFALGGGTPAPCRAWQLPCGDREHVCGSEEQYQQFASGPQPDCPMDFVDPTPNPPGVCILVADECQFVDSVPTCEISLPGCQLDYDCTTDTEVATPTTGACGFNKPPLPPMVCTPADEGCDWYSPCKMWNGFCNGPYVCGTESEYWAYIYGPQPLCTEESENVIPDPPPGECLWSNGECSWSECTAWLDWCQVNWNCGTNYQRETYFSGPVPACPYPGDNYQPPEVPGSCDFNVTSGTCQFIGCSGGKAYSECGTACPRTCENYELDFACVEVCVEGCFCPEGTVESSDGECIESLKCSCDCPIGHTCEVYEPTSELYCQPSCDLDNGGCSDDQECSLVEVQCFKAPCPPVVQCVESCPNITGQEYSECASPCPATCSQPYPLCTAVCQPGCACPTGQVIHEESARCVLLEECSTQECPPGKEYTECGTACPLTCDNYGEPLTCTLQCVQGCFCPSGMVEKGDECVAPSDCGCPDIAGQEYSECASPCPATCSQPYPLCATVCQPGCACPTGQVIHEESARCVLLEECSTQECPPGKEYTECGTACPLTCDNYGEPLPCTLQCVQGCFCPSGMVENGDECVAPSDCPATGCTAINGQEYSECASPCPATCSQPDPLCIAVCQPGCACPTGQVIHEESARCVLLEECSTQGCPPGKEYDECGTACPLTCDNYNVPLPCTDECVQGCFCSPGLVENGDQCIDPSDCQTDINPCAYTDCFRGYICEVYEPTQEAYCRPSCDYFECETPREVCTLRKVQCSTDPCVPEMSCIDSSTVAQLHLTVTSLTLDEFGAAEDRLVEDMEAILDRNGYPGAVVNIISVEEVQNGRLRQSSQLQVKVHITGDGVSADDSDELATVIDENSSSSDIKIEKVTVVDDDDEDGISQSAIVGISFGAVALALGVIVLAIIGVVLVLVFMLRKPKPYKRSDVMKDHSSIDNEKEQYIKLGEFVSIEK